MFAVILLAIVNSGRDHGASKSSAPGEGDSESADNTADERSLRSQPAEPKSTAGAESEPMISEANPAKEVAALETPPEPEPVAAVEPPRDDNPVAVGEKPVVDEAQPTIPTALAALSPEAVEAKLNQKIARFDQPRPVPFVRLLETVEELAGVPIVWDLERVDDVQLQKSVTLQLKETTVAEILDTLLRQAGLERRTVAGKIELHPKLEPAPRP